MGEAIREARRAATSLFIAMLIVNSALTSSQNPVWMMIIECVVAWFLCLVAMVEVRTLVQREIARR
jgi:hypothetical protein